MRATLQSAGKNVTASPKCGQAHATYLVLGNPSSLQYPRTVLGMLLRTCIRTSTLRYPKICHSPCASPFHHTRDGASLAALLSAIRCSPPSFQASSPPPTSALIAPLPADEPAPYCDIPLGTIFAFPPPNRRANSLTLELPLKEARQVQLAKEGRCTHFVIPATADREDRPRELVREAVTPERPSPTTARTSMLPPLAGGDVASRGPHNRDILHLTVAAAA